MAGLRTSTHFLGQTAAAQFSQERNQVPFQHRKSSFQGPPMRRRSPAVLHWQPCRECHTSCRSPISYPPFASCSPASSLGLGELVHQCPPLGGRTTAGFASTRQGQLLAGVGMTVVGAEARFPPPLTIPDLPALAAERGVSTQSRRSSPAGPRPLVDPIRTLSYCSIL